MLHEGPLGDEKAKVRSFPSDEYTLMPLGYYEVPRNELVQPYDLCWHPHNAMWGSCSGRTGERVRDYHCIVGKRPKVQNQVTIE